MDRDEKARMLHKRSKKPNIKGGMYKAGKTPLYKSEALDKDAVLLFL